MNGTIRYKICELIFAGWQSLSARPACRTGHPEPSWEPNTLSFAFNRRLPDEFRSRFKKAYEDMVRLYSCRRVLLVEPVIRSLRGSPTRCPSPSIVAFLMSSEADSRRLTRIWYAFI